jgi:hypothetical protein
MTADGVGGFGLARREQEGLRFRKKISKQKGGPDRAAFLIA